jgi:hypothetical protein
MARFEPGELADWPLVRAARELNAEAEEVGVGATVERHGLDMDKLQHIADQRAMRAVFARHGVNLNPDKPVLFDFTDEDKAMLPLLMAVSMEGMLIGWYGRELAELVAEEEASGE